MTAIATTEQVGLNCYLYYNSATYGSPTWVTIARAQDVSVPWSTKESDVGSRNSGHEFTLPSLMKTGIEFGYLYKRGTDAVWTALMTNAMARIKTPLDMVACDDDITLTGAKGIRFTGNVFNADQNQPLSDGVTQKFSVKPFPTRDPELLTT